MLVTAITSSPRRTGRFDIAVDGAHAATLSLEAIERLKLSLGTAIDARLEAAIARETGIVATYDRALNMIALRPRASAELRRVLMRKGEPPEFVDVAIDRLVKAGFLDDASFARQFTRSKAVGAGLSRRRLQQELARRGIAREVADASIDQVFDEEKIDEHSTLEHVARKKMKSLARLDVTVQRRRLYAFLVRRGYDLDDIARTLDASIRVAREEQERARSASDSI